MDSFTIALVSNAPGEFVSKHYTHLFYKLFTRATKLGGAMVGCNFRNILPINVPEYNSGQIQVF